MSNSSRLTPASVRRLTGLVLCLMMTNGPVVAKDDDEVGWFIPKNTPLKNFYGGVGVDMAKNDFPDSNQDGSVSGVSTDESGAGVGVFFGYQVTENVAVQGGYRNLGEAEFGGTSSGGPSWAPGNVRAEHEADGWELGILGRWPITDRWYALGFVGAFWWESKETYYESVGKSTFSESGSDASYALGFEYDVGLKDRIVYRFMGSHHSVGKQVEYDVNSASAAMIYRFP